MKHVLFVSASVMAFVAQSASAAEAPKVEKTFTAYGSVYGNYSIYNSAAPSLREGAGLEVKELRLGALGNFGIVKSDVQLELTRNLAGNGGPDWDNAQAPIDLEPQTAGFPSADKVYKSIWNTQLRKAYGEVATPTGGKVLVGIIRPDGGTSNGLYMATGLEGYDSVLGATLAQPAEFGPAKITFAVTAMNKLHAENATYEVAAVNGTYKAILLSAKGTVADNTAVAFSFGNDYGYTVVGGEKNKGVTHIEASAAHTLDAISAGLWFQNESFVTRYSKAAGSKVKLGCDVVYQVNDSIKGIVTYVRKSGSDTTAADVKTTDNVQQEIWVGPSYLKNGLVGQFAAVFAINEEKVFTKNGKPLDSKTAMGAMLTAGYEF